jgi:hypothetical protein
MEKKGRRMKKPEGGWSRDRIERKGPVGGWKTKQLKRRRRKGARGRMEER